MENIDRENFDEEALIRQIHQNFPPSNICTIQYLKADVGSGQETRN